MLYRNCCRNRNAKLRTKILSQAALSAIAEPLESRLHLSYDNRGTISVIVDGTIASSISTDVAQYEQDLIGDGWRIAPDIIGQMAN